MKNKLLFWTGLISLLLAADSCTKQETVKECPQIGNKFRKLPLANPLSSKQKEDMRQLQVYISTTHVVLQNYLEHESSVQAKKDCVSLMLMMNNMDNELKKTIEI